MSEATKVCRGCKETKALELFSKAARGRDGYAPRCKQCAKEYAKVLHNRGYRYIKDKEKAKAHAKKYYDKHKKEINKRAYEKEKVRMMNDPAYRAMVNEKKRELYQKHKETVCDKGKKKRLELTDSYIKSLMNVSADTYVPQEQIEQRRQQVIEIRNRIEHNRNSAYRTCSSCGNEKLKTEFYLHGGYCKVCSIQKSKEYLKANPEKQKQYYDKHKDRIIEASKKWHRENRNRSIELSRAWRKANPDADKRYRDKTKHKRSAMFKQSVRNLDDRYIKHLFTKGGATIPKSEIPQALIEAKRLQILIKRRVKDEDSNRTT